MSGRWMRRYCLPADRRVSSGHLDTDKACEVDKLPSRWGQPHQQGLAKMLNSAGQSVHLIVSCDTRGFRLPRTDQS